MRSENVALFHRCPFEGCDAPVTGAGLCSTHYAQVSRGSATVPTDDTLDYPRRSGWVRSAACREVDPELFFPVGIQGPAQRQTEQAKDVCAGCPVRTQCLTWALATRQDAGVWGGMSEHERRDLLSSDADARALVTAGGVR